MDVCKCIVPLRHGGTLNSRRVASPLVRLVEGKERWEALITSGATAASPSEYMREYRARKKTLQNTLLMLSLRDGNAIETLLMTAQINTDPVPLTTEPSSFLVRVGADACKSIINSILRYEDYDSHKNAQNRSIDNHSIHTGVQFIMV
ncbi:uncharacterized protein TNCV_4471191 [Trichonephila clavipes]|uniref:Uncharacterized protein n=1 Tax=Trichonephila clavipes TaxID=2585209 RepID=A0A8X6SQG0_TRICX|nr:uncharacterized protein TNCV_4471191 [Trichonephila clavipes]